MANVRDDEDKCVGLTDMPLKATEAECKVGRSIFAKGQEKIQPVRVESLSDGMSGVPLEGPNHVVYLSQANSAGIDVVQNEAVNQEAGNCGLSLSLFQQQMMLNQQMLVQQQHTMTSLISQVDKLSKHVRQNNTAEETVGVRCTPPTSSTFVSRKRKLHDISSCEDVSTDSDNNSVSDSEIDGNHSQVHDNMPVSLPLETDKVHVSTNMKLLQDMGQEFDREEVLGPKVNETLARVVNSGIRAKIDRNVAKELCEKFVRPRNCEALVVPKINKELWNTSAFKKTTKEGDKCFQTAQRYMSQGLIPLVSLMDKLLETDQAEEFRLAKESFQLLAYAHRDISNIRRQQLKGVVSDKYKQLCNDSTPLTGNLLGDDLEKQIKTLDEMRKVGFDLSTIRNKDRTVGKYQPRSSTSSYSKQKKFRQSYKQAQHTYSPQTGKDNSFLFKRGRHLHNPSAMKKSHRKPEDHRQ